MNNLLINIAIFCSSICLCLGQTWDELNVEPNAIMTYTVNDTLSFPVFLIETSEKKELLYGARLETDVCNDQICLPIQVNLFWDLLGNFHHFSREKDVHFTKFDHDYFVDEDYQKLQEILMDTLAVLRDYDVEDLLEKKPNKYSAEVDAVTKPTAPLFSNVTVPGALYTVYTLWHIVNGSIKQELRKYLDENYQKNGWSLSFATSSIPTYQTYFLNHISSWQVKKYEQQIVELLFADDDYVPHDAIDVLGDTFWSKPNRYNAVLGRITMLKSHVITKILNIISEPDHQTETILIAFQESGGASDKQKELILKICKDEKQ